MKPVGTIKTAGQALPEYLLATIMLVGAGLYLAAPGSPGSAVSLVQAALSQTWLRLALSLSLPG